MTQGFLYDDNISEILTPNNLLYGRKLEFENKCVYEGCSDYVSQVLMPNNSFMHGRKMEFENKCVDEGCFEFAEGNDLWLKKCVVQKVVERFWLMWHGKYLDGLRKIIIYRKVGKGASEIRVSDVVVIEEDVVPRHRWRLDVVMELLKGNDGYVRGAKVKVGKTKNIIWCPVN